MPEQPETSQENAQSSQENERFHFETERFSVSQYEEVYLLTWKHGRLMLVLGTSDNFCQRIDDTIEELKDIQQQLEHHLALEQHRENLKELEKFSE